VLFLIIIIIICLIIASYSVTTRKVGIARKYAERKKKLEDKKKKQEMEKQEEDLKYGVYAAKKANVLCHKCGHRNKVTSSTRPLAVTCSQCDTRGVIY
jgi:hypothetical protein